MVNFDVNQVQHGLNPNSDGRKLWYRRTSDDQMFWWNVDTSAYIDSGSTFTQMIAGSGGSVTPTVTTSSLTKPVANGFKQLALLPGVPKSLANVVGGIPATANGVEITLEGDLAGVDEIRYRVDGTAPAAGAGSPLRAGPSGEGFLALKSRDLVLGLQMLLTGDGGAAGANLNIQFFE
jgi:hypothetical protein